MNACATEDKFVSVPSGRLFTRRWTPSTCQTDVPLVLFPDSLGCVALWRDFPDALATRLQRPVIAYDRLGFGRSDRREGVPTAAFVTEEATIYFPALAEELGLTRYALMGHSVGGGMALICAALNPDRCEAVITEAAQAFVEPKTTQGITEAKELFHDPQQFKRLAKYHGDHARWVLDAWTEVWLSAEFASWTLDPYLGSVVCPVLAIHGDKDEYGSLAFPEKIAGSVSGRAQMEILKACGHVPHREQKEAVLQLIERFLSEFAA